MARDRRRRDRDRRRRAFRRLAPPLADRDGIDPHAGHRAARSILVFPLLAIHFPAAHRERGLRLAPSRETDSLSAAGRMGGVGGLCGLHGPPIGAARVRAGCRQLVALGPISVPRRMAVRLRLPGSRSIYSARAACARADLFTGWPQRVSIAHLLTGAMGKSSRTDLLWRRRPGAAEQRSTLGQPARAHSG